MSNIDENTEINVNKKHKSTISPASRRNGRNSFINMHQTTISLMQGIINYLKSLGIYVYLSCIKSNRWDG